MANFIFNQILFYLALILLLFTPGYFLLLAIFGKTKILSSLETFILSFGLGIIINDFIAFVYNKINLPITAFSALAGALIFSLMSYGIFRQKPKTKLSSQLAKSEKKTRSLFSFSQPQVFLIILLIFFTFFIKTTYLTSTVAPTATDMGHHTYWSKVIANSGKLTHYEGMPDFIIGEHIVLAELQLITNLSIFSALPVNFLLLINLLGIFTIFIFTLRVSKNQLIAIFSLLFLGGLFAITSPQTKFVSGGVFGNIMGNYFLPMILYFSYRTFEFLEKGFSILPKKELQLSQKFLSLAFFMTFGLFYTHHLTAFIFLFITLFLVFFYLIMNYQHTFKIIKILGKIIWSPWIITTLSLGIFFFFFVFTPNYFHDSAVKTAVGAPSKATRNGLSLTNLKSSVGEARLALGIIGLFLLALSYKRRNLGLAIIFSWTIMLFLMSSEPQLLFINLPSSRIGNYLSYPLSILSAYGLFFLFRPQTPKYSLSPKLLTSTFFVLLIFILVSGLSDNAQAFKKLPNFTPMVQTFSVAQYLAQRTQPNDIILKDHNYIRSSDTWIKSFFMRGYKYPLSRSYFKRYNDKTKPRENCTLIMISNPQSSDSQKCFTYTHVNFIIVNPLYDSAQFDKLSQFNKIYATNSVVAYYRK